MAILMQRFLKVLFATSLMFMIYTNVLFFPKTGNVGSQRSSNHIVRPKLEIAHASARRILQEPSKNDTESPSEDKTKDDEVLQNADVVIEVKPDKPEEIASSENAANSEDWKQTLDKKLGETVRQKELTDTEVKAGLQSSNLKQDVKKYKTWNVVLNRPESKTSEKDEKRSPAKPSIVHNTGGVKNSPKPVASKDIETKIVDLRNAARGLYIRQHKTSSFKQNTILSNNRDSNKISQGNQNPAIVKEVNMKQAPSSVEIKNCPNGKCALQKETGPSNILKEVVLSRSDHCSYCFVHRFSLLINNKNICRVKSSTDVIDIIILITSAPDHYLKREALRETWLQQAKQNTANIRYAFLLGQSEDIHERRAVWRESENFRDIIKEDFIDAYTNLTYKTVMAMKWATTYCSNAKFVMKTDDDMYINVPFLLASIRPRETALQRKIGGRCNAMAGIPNRNTKSKWYASKLSYPKDRYPKYCSGTAYVTSIEVARQLYEISPSIPFFHLEDVYIGLCLKAAKLGVIDIPGFRIDNPQIDKCRFRQPGIISVHHMSPEMLHMTWNKNCNSPLGIPFQKQRLAASLANSRHKDHGQSVPSPQQRNAAQAAGSKIVDHSQTVPSSQLRVAAPVVSSGKGDNLQAGPSSQEKASLPSNRKYPQKILPSQKINASPAVSNTKGDQPKTVISTQQRVAFQAVASGKSDHSQNAHSSQHVLASHTVGNSKPGAQPKSFHSSQQRAVSEGFNSRKSDHSQNVLSNQQKFGSRIISNGNSVYSQNVLSNQQKVGSHIISNGKGVHSQNVLSNQQRVGSHIISNGNSVHSQNVLSNLQRVGSHIIRNGKGDNSQKGFSTQQKVGSHIISNGKSDHSQNVLSNQQRVGSHIIKNGKGDNSQNVFSTQQKVGSHIISNGKSDHSQKVLSAQQKIGSQAPGRRKGGSSQKAILTQQRFASQAVDGRKSYRPRTYISTKQRVPHSGVPSTNKAHHEVVDSSKKRVVSSVVGRRNGLR